jgi:hypothetical protein
MQGAGPGHHHMIAADSVKIKNVKNQ